MHTDRVRLKQYSRSYASAAAERGRDRQSRCTAHQVLRVDYAAARFALTLPLRCKNRCIEKLLQQLLHSCRAIVSTEPFGDGQAAEFDDFSTAQTPNSDSIRRTQAPTSPGTYQQLC